MPLTEEELEEFRRLLTEQRDSLLSIQETGNQAANVVELDQTKVGRLSRMDAMQAQAMSQETNRRREIQMQRIRSALDRLDSSGFGYCIACDEEISPERLQIEPSVLVCIHCAEKS